MILGLTGTFGSGKTTVAEMFRTLGARIIDADKIARDIVEPSLSAYHEIVSEFGKEVIMENGHLNRQKIRDIIFDDPEKRKRLNEIMHPKIRQVEMELLNQWKDEPLVVFNVPLLFENKLEKYVDKVLVVRVDHQTRIERLQKREPISKEQIRRILESQMSDEEKIARADFVIDNSRSIRETFQQVQQLIKQLKIPLN